MVHTFGAAVSRASQRADWYRPIAAHVMGGCVGGALLATPLFLAQSDPEVRAFAAIVLTIVTLAALAGAVGLGKPIHQWTRRQVPEHWRRYFGGSTTGFLYGVGLGVGVGTKIPSALFPASLLLVVAADLPFSALIAGLAFGVMRTAMHGFLAYRARQSTGLARIERLLEASASSAMLAANALAGVALGFVGWSFL